MKTKYLSLIVGLQIASLSMVFGQDQGSLIKPDASAIDPNISDSDIEIIIGLTQQTLDKYSEVATFISEENVGVNEESEEAYYSVFNMNLAKVMQDYKRYPPQDLIEPSEYVIKIENFFFEGFEFEIKNPQIVKITNFQNYYSVTVELAKVVFSVIGANGNVEDEPSGIWHKQKFTFDINKSKMDIAKITEISNATKAKPVEPYTNIFNLSVGVGSSTYSPSMSSYWNSEHSSSGLDANSGLDFSIGVEYISNKFITAKSASERKIAWSAGVMFSSYQVNTTLSSFSSKFDAIAENNTGSQKYQRLVNLGAIEEEIRYSAIQVPFGIGFRIKDDPTYLIHTFFKVIPSFMMGGSGTLSGSSVYDGILYLPDEVTLSDLRILDDMAANQETLNDPNHFGPYDVGEQDINVDAKPNLASTFLTLQLSPTAYFKFENRDPVWGLSVGIDLGYQLSSFITHDPISSNTEDPLGDSTDFNGSLLNYFSNDMSGFHFALRVGLFRFSEQAPH